MKKVFFSLLFILFFLTGHSYGVEKTYLSLKRGKTSFDNKDYDLAAKQLSIFLKTPTILDDYALLWRANAYMELSQIDRAMADINKIKSKFKKSPIYKDALKLEIRAVSIKTPENGLSLIETYLKKYHDENDIRFLYGILLKKANRKKDAQSVFKKIYLEGDEYSKDALHYINREKLSSFDLLTRAKNLMSRHRHRESEKELRMALRKSPSKTKGTINKYLASALFKQKKYHQAATYYRKSGDLYNEANSLFREDYKKNKVRFNKNLEILTRKGDHSVVDLKIKMSLSLRRNGETDTALKILESIKNEKALWYKGWIYYRKKDFQKSYEIFNSLYTNYKDSMYLYWTARSLENSGGNASNLYSSLNTYDDFYTALSTFRDKKKNLPVKSNFIKKPEKNKKWERLAILLDLKIKDAIENESKYLLENVNKDNTNQILKLSIMLNNADLYYESIKLAKNLPNKENLHRILYPYGYKDIVDEASTRFSTDPLLILSIIREESRFQANVYSSAGAIGLMQIVPQTAKKMGRKIGLYIKNSKDILDARKNILIGTYYLKYLTNMFESLPPALASYNAGEYNVKKWLATNNYNSMDEFVEDIPYRETRKYVKRVLKTYYQYTRAYSPDKKIEL